MKKLIEGAEIASITSGAAWIIKGKEDNAPFITSSDEITQKYSDAEIIAEFIDGYRTK